jgi:hypothetical protein
LERDEQSPPERAWMISPTDGGDIETQFGSGVLG